MPTEELPPSNTEDSNALLGMIVPCERYDIVSWSPGKLHEKIPPTQVHLLLPMPALNATFVLRLKSARAVDELIQTLQEHRAFTFGGKA